MADKLSIRVELDKNHEHIDPLLTLKGPGLHIHETKTNMTEGALA